MRICSLSTWIAVCAVACTARAAEIDFNRDIRPILSEHCFACHGFDENSREAGLRLDTREGATADLGGYAAVVPGMPADSELISRVVSDDPELLMPPPDSHRKRLAPSDVALLRRWVHEGAPWGKHWAFVPPRKAVVPRGAHPVDFFVRRRLRDEGLVPAARAADHALLRRVSFDLTGLPPSAASPASGLSDRSWEKHVDRLLQSPHFGERMAMWWLDSARYSDTDGFQQDATRTNWPWRDWVVDAFNHNLPFDQFTIEQFAGDLLPEATKEQQLATCFHRNHMNNGEGGRDPEESRVDYVIDRVNTSGTVWLGLTLACTQCHDHKFDPISQRDYYSFAAYFNSIDETGAAGGNAKPILKYMSPYAHRAVLEANALVNRAKAELELARATAEEQADRWVDQQIQRLAQAAEFQAWEWVSPVRLATKEGCQLRQDGESVIQASASDAPQDDYLVTAGSSNLERITGVRLEVFPDDKHTDGKYSFGENGEFILTNLKLLVHSASSSQIREIPLASAVADVNGTGVDKKYANVSGTLDDDPRTGWTTRTKPADVVHQAVFALREPLSLKSDEELEFVLMQRSLDPGALIGRFRLSVTDQPGNAVRSLGQMPLEELNEQIRSSRSSTLTSRKLPGELRRRLVDQFLEDHAAFQQAKSRYGRASRQHNDAKKAAGELSVMVLKQRAAPRNTHVLERGVWDKPGEQVSTGVLPAVLPREPSSVPTRLELARWIVSRDNPLTARVIVNQLWQLLFGEGLVRTPGDFGVQGEAPTHPELLDWLAVEFVESGWDVKRLIRLIVCSETYRQSSAVDRALLERDPQNRLLARGARFRLPSWMIRDAQLASSGLLNPAIGGPPVFPYQPEGVWRDQFMGRFRYQPSLGPPQYRRTLYAFWRRTSAPTFLFDTAMRRTCEVAPRRTNTPLQALTLMNDTTALEAARTLAESLLEEHDGDALLSEMFHKVLGRRPGIEELSILRREQTSALAFYSRDPEAAAELIRVGQLDSLPETGVANLAASMVVANMVFNLDEAITHE